jgi:hypothetical protein
MQRCWNDGTPLLDYIVKQGRKVFNNKEFLCRIHKKKNQLVVCKGTSYQPSTNALDLGVPTTPCEVGSGVLLQKQERKNALTFTRASKVVLANTYCLSCETEHLEWWAEFFFQPLLSARNYQAQILKLPELFVECQEFSRMP